MYSVIQVVDSLNTGGAERVAIDLANGLKKVGCNVFFCVTRHDGPLHSELNSDVTFINLNRNKSYHGLITFRAFIIRNSISIVHAHGNSTALFCVLALIGVNSVKIVHHDHNPLLSFRNVLLQKLVLGRVDAWIAVSDEILRWVISKIGYSNAIMLINPIQISRFYKNSNSVRDTREIIVLANYREQKDYENLLSAVNSIRDCGIKFRIAGYGSHSEGDYFKKINAMVESLNLSKLVQLNPSVLNIPELLSNADVGILSSASEGLPISLLEYMASSLPVIVTDVGECGRIVREANSGVVIPPFDSPALGAAIENVLRNAGQWNEWGLNGRKYIEENHAFEVFLEKMVNVVYKNL